MEIVKNYRTNLICSECWYYENPKRFINNRKYEKRKGKRIRAGVLMYDPKEDKLLIVQVYNTYFGLPKGGCEEGETLYETAKRELLEETGVEITIEELEKAETIKLHGSCTYYIIERNVCDVKLHSFKENDVTGVGWIHMRCLCKLNGVITSHLKMCMQKIIDSV